VEGNDEGLKEAAADNALRLGCGHSFVILMRDAFPINVLNQVKMVPEVCTIYAATANPLEVVVAETEQGRGILGVIDGQPPLGVEDEEAVRWRKEFLRKFGYKT
jgi:adenosine/AMP kinase